MNKHDIDIIRGLSERVAGIAALPAQEEKRRLWRALNGKKPGRPMVMIDQVCWHEMGAAGELKLQCGDAECRTYEQYLRRTLYQWDNFRCDMVVEPFVRVEKAIDGWHFGLGINEDTKVGDPENDVISHYYLNQFEADADLDKIKMPNIVHDEAETQRRISVAESLFGGILAIEPYGLDPKLCFWDPICTWMGVEGALWALADRPEYVHELLRRMKASYVAGLDYVEQHGLFCSNQSLIHCTGAYTDDLPADGFDPDKPRAKDIWVMGLAQMFSTVSPAMFEEFEVNYIQDICARYGLVYYGCCDPLDHKMAEVRKIPNVRKVSVSTWADRERAARNIGGDYVFSWKPNPACLVSPSLDSGYVRAEIQKTVDICKREGCPLEIIMKDISTVLYEPNRLRDWNNIAMEVVQSV